MQKNGHHEVAAAVFGVSRGLPSIHRPDIHHASTLAMDGLLGFQHLVEGHEAHRVASLVQAVVVQTGDLDPIDAGLLAHALGHRGD